MVLFQQPKIELKLERIELFSIDPYFYLTLQLRMDDL
jgi:hypothetical protein